MFRTGFSKRAGSSRAGTFKNTLTINTPQLLPCIPFLSSVAIRLLHTTSTSHELEQAETTSIATYYRTVDTKRTAHAPPATMIRDFEAWNANIGELSELQELSGCRVAIEAAHYLQHRILSHPRAREPLVPALGGLPLGMKQYIEEDLNTFESLQIEPWFVFSGLDITKPDDPFQQKQREAGVNTAAWNLYDGNQAEASVAKFGESTYVTPEDLFRFLQSILIERKVHFQIAPYSAWAQVRLYEAFERADR